MDADSPTQRQAKACGLLLSSREARLREQIPTAESVLQAFSGSTLQLSRFVHGPILKSLETPLELLELQRGLRLSSPASTIAGFGRAAATMRSVLRSV